MSIEGLCIDTKRESTFDAEGNVIRPGDEIWVEDTHGDLGFFPCVIAECFEYKVVYTKLCPYDYIGAKCSLIHKQHPQGSKSCLTD